jgi:hypothetical protein
MGILRRLPTQFTLRSLLLLFIPVAGLAWLLRPVPVQIDFSWDSTVTDDSPTAVWDTAKVSLKNASGTTIHVEGNRSQPNLSQWSKFKDGELDFYSYQLGPDGNVSFGLQAGETVVIDVPIKKGILFLTVQISVSPSTIGSRSYRSISSNVLQCKSRGVK